MRDEEVRTMLSDQKKYLEKKFNKKVDLVRKTLKEFLCKTPDDEALVDNILNGAFEDIK